MKKIHYYAGGLFILLAAVLLYFSTREYPVYEIDADNYTELKKVTDVDYFGEYASILRSYYGFGNLRLIQIGIREKISDRNNSSAKYIYDGGDENFESYGVNLLDCTSLSVQLENRKIVKIQQFEQNPRNCPPKGGILEDRVAFLMNQGFTLKESKIKDNDNSILINDLNEDFFHIIRFYYDSSRETVTALEFGLFSKAKYPFLDLI